VFEDSFHGESRFICGSFAKTAAHFLCSFQIDFVMASTHPLNEGNYMADIEHWKKSISENCYDEYELPQCVIVNEEYEGEDLDETATVKFIRVRGGTMAAESTCQGLCLCHGTALHWWRC
jgi:hypothetical protein